MHGEQQCRSRRSGSAGSIPGRHGRAPKKTQRDDHGNPEGTPNHGTIPQSLICLGTSTVQRYSCCQPLVGLHRRRSVDTTLCVDQDGRQRPYTIYEHFPIPTSGRSGARSAPAAGSAAGSVRHGDFRRQRRSDATPAGARAVQSRAHRPHSRAFRHHRRRYRRAQCRGLARQPAHDAAELRRQSHQREPHRRDRRCGRGSVWPAPCPTCRATSAIATCSRSCGCTCRTSPESGRPAGTACSTLPWPTASSVPSSNSSAMPACWTRSCAMASRSAGGAW